MNKTNESYNGWKNWDTWSAHLWLSDESPRFYHAMRMVYSAKNAELVGTGLLTSIGNPDRIDFKEVDWQEIYEAFNE